MANVWTEDRHGGTVVRWRDPKRLTASGKPGRGTSGVYASKADALAAAAEMREKLGPTRRRRKAGARPTAALPLAQLAERWATENGDDTPGHDDYLAEVQATVARLAEALQWRTSADANAGAVREYLEANGGRGRRQLSYLRSVLRWGAKVLDQPLDLKADQALAAPPSQENDLDLLSAAHVAEIRERAKEFEIDALVECLLTYGWRPATACRILVGDVDFDRASISIGVKHSGKPWRHPLIPCHVEQLRRCAADRSKEEALFLNPQGEPWRLHRGSASQLASFFRDNIRPGGAEGNVYQLKRWAITKMDEGADPWRRKLSTAQIALYTGHRTKSQIQRYLRTNEDDARDVIAEQADENLFGFEKGISRGHEGATICRKPPGTTEDDNEKVLKFPGIAG